MELSERLQAVAGLVTEGASVADIGTDHGYIPIFLIRQGIARKAVALDINEGPLERARSHIRAQGLEGKIQTRLSDGLENVRPGEADTMIAAGMGGPLVIRILSEGQTAAESMDDFILQPQSEIQKVRRYLNEQGYRIQTEDMVCEGGKYYPVMKAVHGEAEDYDEWQYLYGKRLLEARHPVLCRYLHREIGLKQRILSGLKEQGKAEGVRERCLELRREIEGARRMLSLYYGQHNPI